MGWRVIAKSEAGEIVEEMQWDSCHGRRNDVQMCELYVKGNVRMVLFQILHEESNPLHDNGKVHINRAYVTRTFSTSSCTT